MVLNLQFTIYTESWQVNILQPMLNELMVSNSIGDCPKRVLRK